MHKFRGVTELFVDAGEAHVGDLIDTGETAHHGITDSAGGNLGVKLGFENIDDVFHQHRDLFVVDGAFVTGGFDGARKFLAVKIFATAITFDDGEAFANERLGSAEAVAAFQTFTTTANRISFPANAGVGHFVLNRGAFWAAHGERVGSVEGEKVLKNFHSAFGRDRLRVKLHSPDRECLMPQPHDFSFGGLGRDFEAIGARLAFEDQGMVARRGKSLRKPGEYIGVAMRNGGSFAVHESIGSHDFSSEVVADGLMAEADAEEGDFTGKCGDHLDGNSGFERRARARGNEDSVGLEGEGFGGRDLVVAKYALLHAQLTEVLDEVKSEGVVVVDDE